MSAAPKGQSKAAEENATTGSPAEGEVLPTPPTPNDPVEEGKVQVETPEKNTRRKTVSKPRKSDSLKDIQDFSKLPVSATVGQVVASVEEYAGRPVLSLSLVGWVGDAPFKLLAADAGEIEQVLDELRKELS